MLWGFLKDRMQLHNNQTICEEEHELAYFQLIKKAEELAGLLKKGEMCAVLCDSELNASVSVLACMASQAVALPLSFRYGEKHYNRILETIQPTKLLTDRNGNLECIELISANANVQAEDDVCLILCTSGTTGVPKGAMITQDNLMSNLTDIEKYFRISNQDTILIVRPIYHCAVLTGELLISLMKGLNIRFFSKSFNPVELVKCINKYKITLMGGTPTLFYHVVNILKRENNDELSLNKIVISGECLSEKVAKELIRVLPNVEKYNVYGLTEASPRVSYLPPECFNDCFMSVGKPLFSVEAKVVDEFGKEVENEAVGELVVKGPNVMKGYFNNIEATSRVIVDGWLHTGDLAYIKDGYIFIKGRKDHMIIRGGVNIYPSEIENALKVYPEIKEVMAYGIKDNVSSQSIGIKVVTDKLMTNVEIFNICRKCLPDYELPNVIEIVDALPRNASGKIMRKTVNLNNIIRVKKLE